MNTIDPRAPRPTPETDKFTNLRGKGPTVVRVRYRVDVQSVSGRWDNVEIRGDETIARRDEAEWRSWLNENRKNWKDIRIVKETTTAEVLQNDEMRDGEHKTIANTTTA